MVVVIQGSNRVVEVPVVVVSFSSASDEVVVISFSSAADEVVVVVNIQGEP